MMKKLMILLTVSCLVCGLALAGGKGAVKADMVVHTDSGTVEMPAGTVVGSVNLNTTAEGCLIVVVNLDDAVEGIYDSLVHINGTKILDQVAVDCLKVNAKGQGTANYKVDLGDIVADDDTEIEVKVVVRPSFSPNTTPCYVNGPAWGTEIVVPLK
ncbi:MAG: hypothetical protein ACYS14_12700 [Planctomycetota bacterium]|jgi:hypothetical protein